MSARGPATQPGPACLLPGPWCHGEGAAPCPPTQGLTQQHCWHRGELGLLPLGTGEATDTHSPPRCTAPEGSPRHHLVRRSCQRAPQLCSAAGSCVFCQGSCRCLGAICHRAFVGMALGRVGLWAPSASTPGPHTAALSLGMNTLVHHSPGEKSSSVPAAGLPGATLRAGDSLGRAGRAGGAAVVGLAVSTRCPLALSPCHPPGPAGARAVLSTTNTELLPAPAGGPVGGGHWGRHHAAKS